MLSQNHSGRRSFIDKVARSTAPTADDSNIRERSAWWWIFFMPGKVILWIAYMFPNGVGGAFGSARRRNVPLLQVLYSLYFYFLFVVMGLTWLFISSHRQ